MWVRILEIPTVPDLRERISSLSPENRIAFEKMLHERLGTATALSKISRRIPADSTPVSFAQQRLWFLHQFDPASPLYNIPAALPLKGLISTRALEYSFNEIVRRHEVLRTTFATENGEPVQIIASELKVPLPVRDLRSLDVSQRQDEAKLLSIVEARQPFDLSTGPLLRTTLLRLGEEEHLLLLTMHHIVSDGWSMEILFRELRVLYEASCAGRLSPLPELTRCTANT